MCGIAGVRFFGDSDRIRAGEIASGMLRAIAHRGPDGSDVWVSPGEIPAVAFAHARLAIIDLSDAGRQPMHRNGLTAVFNGEIYNYRELRAEMAAQGDVFRTQSDTEVLLAAVERWGRGAIERLEGMFAFAVWNARDRSLLLARDRLGVKPLYYRVDAHAAVFASEVRALLASGLASRELDADSLWHFLGYQTAPTPLTLLRDVRMLEPGQWIEIADGGAVDRGQYWDLMTAAAPSRDVQTRDAARAGVRQRLFDAVQSHLVSDVPVGIFLSGGLDSAALVSLVRTTGAVPRTFTVSFDESSYDESDVARDIVREFAADHTEVRLTGSDLLDMLPAVLAGVDHPSGDGVNSYVVSRAVRAQGVKVALSGLGGDEVFGGYPSFQRLPRLMPAMEQWRKSPEPVRRAAAGLVRAVGGSRVGASKLAAVMEGDGTLASVWPITRQVFSAPDRLSLLEPSWHPAAEARDRYAPLLTDAYARAPEADVFAAVSYAEARAYMHDVLLRDTDQMSMAHALEVRVPLLDHRLVEYVVGLPAHLKSADDRPKALLAESLPAPLPRRLLDLPKRGFTLPFDVWMRGPLKTFCERELGSNGLDGRGLFRPGVLPGLWRRFLDRSPGITWSRIWTLVALNAWMDRHGIVASRS